MFASIDKNEDDKLSYKEFKRMINPPDIPQSEKPHISAIGIKPHLFSPFTSPTGINLNSLQNLPFYLFLLGESKFSPPVLAQTPGNMLFID